jgi:hypothetical protein
MVDVIPIPEEKSTRGRGRPRDFSDRLILKALIIMVIRRLYSAYSLLAFLEQDTELTVKLRPLLMEKGRMPTRRTWERRLKSLPDSLPGLIGCMGRYLVSILKPWATQGRAAVWDSTPLKAKGGVWHKKDREKGFVPHTTIDTEAHWSKSGYHGWWYGWKLHMASVIGTVWIPLAAHLTPANEADNKVAPKLLHELPLDTRYILGDTTYNDPELRKVCERTNRLLVATKRGPLPHLDQGSAVRQIFHLLRTKAIEPFNGLFKNIFEWSGQVPVKGLLRTQLIVLGAVLLYQMALLYQFKNQKDIGRGIKPLLRAA